MTRILLFSMLILVSATVRGLSQNVRTYTDITVEALDSLISLGDVVMLDVRTPQETAEGKIDEAIEADVLSADFKIHLQHLDKDKRYVVYCRSGRRSVMASRIMVEERFLHVYNLVGGYEEWARQSQ